MVQGFVRRGFWPRRAEATLGTAAKQTVVLGRHPLASGVNVISTVGVALAYFFAARLSLALLEPVDGVAVFWPAAGVASGILIALGSAARWPVVLGVVAATIAANLLGDRNIWNSVSSAVANAGEAVIVAGLIHRFCGSPFELKRTAKGAGTICRDRCWNEPLRHCGYCRLCTVSGVGRVPAGDLAALVLI